jgi:hypothetical protein
MKIKVSVEKRMYCTGAVIVDCETVDQAIELVEAQIHTGELQTTAVDWSHPEYEDFTFQTTGDVDDAE